LVAAAVLDNDHLGGIIFPLEKSEDLFQCMKQALFFVIGRDDDRKKG